MQNTFTAIDFETAHPKRWSICQVGIVQVENGKIINEIDLLVQPPDNHYWLKFIAIHGISLEDTKNSPTFNNIWHKTAPFIEGQNLAAHNGLRFDFPVLNQTLEYYNIQVPNYNKFDTYQIYGDNLASLCRQQNIPLNHHDALSDAGACAELYLRHIRK